MIMNTLATTPCDICGGFALPGEDCCTGQTRPGWVRRTFNTVPAWFRIVPGDDPASCAANLSNWQGVVLVSVVMPVMLSLIFAAHVLSAGTPVSTTASVGTPLSSSSCGSDTDCAWRDARVAQDGYGVPVYAGTPHVTPMVEESRMGTSVRLSCDSARSLVMTDDGWACLPA